MHHRTVQRIHTYNAKSRGKNLKKQGTRFLCVWGHITNLVHIQVIIHLCLFITFNWSRDDRSFDECSQLIQVSCSFLQSRKITEIIRFENVSQIFKIWFRSICIIIHSFAYSNFETIFIAVRKCIDVSIRAETRKDSELVEIQSNVSRGLLNLSLVDVDHLTIGTLKCFELKIQHRRWNYVWFNFILSLFSIQNDNTSNNILYIFIQFVLFYYYFILVSVAWCIYMQLVYRFNISTYNCSLSFFVVVFFSDVIFWNCNLILRADWQWLNTEHSNNIDEGSFVVFI